MTELDHHSQEVGGGGTKSALQETCDDCVPVAVSRGLIHCNARTTMRREAENLFHSETCERSLVF